MEALQKIFLLLYLFTGVIMDFATRKISNGWILFGLAVGFICSFLEGGITGVALSILGMCISLLLLVLFVFRALGAGDIKLFMVIGVFLLKDELLKIMVVSFLLGGVGALWKLIRTGGFKKRFSYLWNYVLQVAVTGKMVAYKKNVWEDDAVIHFSLYIFLAVALVLGGVV